MNERRQHPRKSLSTSVRVEFEGTVLEASSDDLSLGGMKLTLGAPQEGLDVGSTMRVSFSLPEVEFPVEIAAQVRWLNRIDGRQLGLQFTEGLRAAHVWSLDRLQ